MHRVCCAVKVPVPSCPLKEPLLHAQRLLATVGDAGCVRHELTTDALDAAWEPVRQRTATVISRLPVEFQSVELDAFSATHFCNPEPSSTCYLVCPPRRAIRS